jgi:hypothetical protein
MLPAQPSQYTFEYHPSTPNLLLCIAAGARHDCTVLFNTSSLPTTDELDMCYTLPERHGEEKENKEKMENLSRKKRRMERREGECVCPFVSRPGLGFTGNLQNGVHDSKFLIQHHELWMRRPRCWITDFSNGK